MNRLVALLTTFIVVASLGMNVSSATHPGNPHLNIDSVIFTNRIGGLGLVIHNSFSIEEIHNMRYYVYQTNFSNLRGFKISLNESIFYPASANEINTSYFVNYPTGKKIQNHMLDFTLDYRGNSFFKYLEILETIDGVSNINVDQSQNFSSATYTGNTFYQINASSGNRYVNLYFEGIIDNQHFIQLYVNRFVNYSRILIVFPLSGVSSFEFQEIELTNFNLSAPQEIVTSVNENPLSFLSLGLLIGVVLILSVILYYRKKQ